MKAHIWETGHTILSISVTNLGHSIALCGQGKEQKSSWDFRFLNSNFMFKQKCAIILVKKEKKLKSLLHKEIKIIATQGLEMEAASEEKPRNCYIVPHCLCQRFPSTSPSALPSCWRTASVSARTLTAHTAQGLRDDLNMFFLIKLRAGTDIPGMHHILQIISILFPLATVRGNNSAASLVIRSHLSLL